MDTLSQDKVEFIISIAREMGEASQAIIGEELADDTAPQHYSELTMAAQAEGSTQEEYAGDSAYQQFKSAVNGMNEEERNELVALLWLGRGTYNKAEWGTAVADARDASNDHTAEYLMRAPLLPDYLTEGLAIMVEE
ncbi:hypothetical protein MNBD_ALPHA01-637 [hydrothermal vent metagenome]|uniref:DUF3775 domain-containing protein n=1 Tax=hydrothermal vent metagenome TaxID=652676 RepID=A0A3B0SET0_9ZZZZ